MATILRKVPLERIISDPNFIVKSVHSKYVFDPETNKPTDKLEGHSYTVVSLRTFDVMNVVVPGEAPVATDEEVQAAAEAGEHITVQFKEAKITPYVSRAGSIEDSIKAQAVIRVKPATK